MEKGHQVQSTHKELLFGQPRLQKQELRNERKSKTLLFPWILNFSSVPYPEAELRVNGVTWLWDLGPVKFSPLLFGFISFDHCFCCRKKERKGTISDRDFRKCQKKNIRSKCHRQLDWGRSLQCIGDTSAVGCSRASSSRPTNHFFLLPKNCLGSPMR